MRRPEDYSPERLRDRVMIQDVIYELCRAVDRRDTEAIRTAYHPDGIDNHGPFVGGPNEYAKFSQERNESIPYSMHHVSNILIEFAGPDLALVETYLWSVTRYGAGNLAGFAEFAGAQAAAAAQATGIDAFGCHRYVDRFQRRDGEWRILRRTVVFDWRTTIPLPPTVPQFNENWTLGNRTPDDWLFKERAALGLQPRR